MTAIDLSTARILVTNDDGVNAPGIHHLEKIARTLSDDVWVVAPTTNQTAMGHSLTLRTPLRMHKLSGQTYSVDGTPTDCVVMAIWHLLKDQRPALLLSGVNKGENLAEDVTYSGTVAAAMEGALLGIPSIALSQSVDFEHPDHPVKWGTAEHYAADLIRKLCAVGWARDIVMNVNFPNAAVEDVKGIRVIRQGRRKTSSGLEERLDPVGRPYYWVGALNCHKPHQPATDLDLNDQGYVTVTPLKLDFTDYECLAQLEGVF